jgi:GTP cyclohydrolase I
MSATAKTSDYENLPDHANEHDGRALAIDKVGIKDLSYPIQVMDRQNEVQHTVARVNLFVSLSQDFKGTHMSRFIEILNARRGEMTIRSMPHLLEEIQNRLGSDDAHIEVRFPYFISKRAPVSGVESLMEYPCAFKASKRTGDMDFSLVVNVPVKSLCPCSKSISDYGAHNQRSVVSVEIRSSDFIWIEQVVEVVESCASAPLYALLKREDEKYVTEQAYDNPKFVEDLVRDVVLKLQGLPGSYWMRVGAENFESIHNHSAYAEIEWSVDKEKARLLQGTRLPEAEQSMDEEVSFGTWLADFRHSRAYSQQEFATLLGVSAAHLSRVEAGDKRLSLEKLKLAAEKLGQDPEIMLLRAGVVPEGLMQSILRSPESFREWAKAGQRA